MVIWPRPCVWHLRSGKLDAPFHHELADGPKSVRAFRRTCSDGVQVRLACWSADAPKGTVLLFPGRSEYVEKYGRVASVLTAAGFAVIAIDWRGQGLSDRLTDDPQLGHVGQFSDYQRDVAELVAQTTELELPRPWFLIAHSMGGCIGYRALAEGLNIARTVFSAPMWGIQMSPLQRPLAHVVPALARAVSLGQQYAPGTTKKNYTTTSSFRDNALTSDPDTYEWLRQHALSVEAFALGGPSIHWVGEAVEETASLVHLARPNCSVRTYLGTDESIVSADAVRKLHTAWPSAELVMVEGALHELMMERPAIRNRFMDETTKFFSDHTAE